MTRLGEIGHKLYTGDISFDFVGKRKLFYIISAALLVISLAAIPIRGLTLGIEFVGGADFQVSMPVASQTVDEVREAVEGSGVPELDDIEVTTIGDNTVRVQTRTLDAETEVPAVRAAIGEIAGVPGDQVTYSLIGASWGQQITQQAVIALFVFLALVSLMIGVYFRNWKMSLTALTALIHDLILTVGIYALSGFTVTPATLIGMLTILGYSLYDTVVVFDKVRENVRDIKSSNTKTYSEAANLAVNQVLVRSINTTVIGVLPVAALLFAGAFILGVGPLKDLSLALFVGMVSGAYSSIFIATPLLAQLKEREPEMKKLAARVAARRSKQEKAAAPADGSKSASKPAGVRADATSEPESTAEPTNAELAERGEGSADEAAESSSSPSIPISVGSASTPPARVTRPLSDAAAKRPQPQHKPRSQRRKS
ncbi:protein translocase subunit SecF [Microlunatus speluncae]|uniref:protein translocase subunit SecF n=1 Tax=Microlunatus speluncae TaxID=2594267 RepID=UPI0012660826|nr:protein translocase subunit SecF [Microlunatus speluncae]